MQAKVYYRGKLLKTHTLPVKFATVKAAKVAKSFAERWHGSGKLTFPDLDSMVWVSMSDGTTVQFSA